jgi:MFS family permease
VLAVSAGITFLTTREQPTSQNASNHNRVGIRGVFHLDVRGHTSFFWLIASRFVFLFGVYGVQTFAQYFIRDVMRAPNPVKATGDLMAALALALVACAVLGGWLTDRVGARRVLVLASGLCALGSFLLAGVQDLATLTLYAGVLGAGIGFYLTSNWALASRLAPSQQAGKFLGLTNLATAGASALSKLAGIPIDIINNAFPGRFYGYMGLFLVGGVCALLSLLLLAKVKEERTAPA